MSDTEVTNASERSRRSIFILELVYLGALIGLALYATRRPRLWTVPDPLGPVPLAVAWFGAVGGVMISLMGVFDHRKDWDSTWVPWHIARPATAGVMASIAYLFFRIITIAATTDAEGAGSPAAFGAAPSKTQLVTYYVVAFLVGYREENFRELVKRMVDMFFRPGEPAGAPPSAAGGAPAPAPPPPPPEP